MFTNSVDYYHKSVRWFLRKILVYLGNPSHHPLKKSTDVMVYSLLSNFGLFSGKKT